MMQKISGIYIYIFFTKAIQGSYERHLKLWKFLSGFCHVKFLSYIRSVTASFSAVHATLCKSSCTSNCRERAQDFEVSAPFVITLFSDYVTTRAQHVAMNKTPV